ncbi:MAG: YiiD C-terminal domain-containing protein [Chromatiaceae bacterium]|nr:YiiD C-terminal domain-containing protein [Gammaproteobacteria bacterium]MCB1880883.1 YiiD C-terminal domain-containing protein [Gammaproteobacteria bacterium]MCP5427995.1 YiiD C-terminal domain-containing protein [Chromatiaceae bacterium]MCP5447229.1 YiiD C-terminal domain-containing protein [Chromatiaceae bacterium]
MSRLETNAPVSAAVRLAALTQTLHREVPLTRQMGVSVVDYDGNRLTVTADFGPNVNIHGTAFGGSQFSICAVAGWALLHLKYEEAGTHALSVLGNASIDYFSPVKGEIRAQCGLPQDGTFEPFMRRVGGGERAAIALVTEILAGDKVAARFRGRYSALFQ